MTTAIVAAALLTTCSGDRVETLENTTLQSSPTINGEIHSDSGTIVAPASGLPDSAPYPLVDPTAFFLTQDAALAQSHQAGPTLAPGDSSITPVVGPQTEAEIFNMTPQSTANPPEVMQTREAALDESHGVGPTLAPGTSSTTTTDNAPVNNQPQSAQNQSSVANRILLGGFILLSIILASILGYRLINKHRSLIK